MIQSNRALVVVAVSALGLAGWSGQDPAPDEAAPPASPAAGAAAARPNAEKFVLLTDGRAVKGEVTVDEDEEKVFVSQPAGRLPFPSRRVERIFNTLAEVHAYKTEQVPEDDIDEQLKLAQWCLSVEMRAEADAHLQQVLNLDPKHKQANTMRLNLKAAEVRQANKANQVDEQVQRSGGDVVDQGPAELSDAIVRRAQRGLGMSDLPVVFDLPPNAALMRAQEFKNYVHPVLQLYCAKCHDEKYDGSFQLIYVPKQSRQTPEVLRANLDATLRIVDREDPNRSTLLVSSLLPHGKGQNTRPIFGGSNDKAYQILANWVKNLRTKPTTNPLAGRAPAPAADGGEGESFAAGRSRIARSTIEVDPIRGPETGGPPIPVRRIETPPMRYEPGRGMVVDDTEHEDAPIPFSVSGVMPRRKGQAAAVAPGEDAVVGNTDPGVDEPLARAPSEDKLYPDFSKMKKKPAAADEDAVEAPPLPDDEGEQVQIPPPKTKKAAKPAKSSVKLDPALLQKTLQQKNGG